MFANFKTTVDSFAARPGWQLRAMRIVLFVVLTALLAKLRIEIPGQPVPITGQTLAVLLAGMALGPLDGALSQLTYLGLIMAGAPIDARGLGPAVLAGPTIGYLIGFIPGALVAGLAKPVPYNQPTVKIVLNFLMGLVAIAVIYVFGTAGVAFRTNQPYQVTLWVSVIPFIGVDIGKALLAAALVNLNRTWWDRYFPRPD